MPVNKMESTMERMQRYRPSATIPSYLRTSGKRRLEMDEAVRVRVGHMRAQIRR